MDARNNLKIIHTVDGAILQNRYGKAVIRSHDIGLISLPTGEIVMADPTLRFEIADFKRKAFQQKVSPGIYPVFAYSAHAGEDRTLAFAEIRFTDQPPVTFTAAKTICDAEQSSRRNCGYVVNESTTGLMDGRFFRESCMRSNSFELDYETALDELLEENLERWGINCAAGIAPNGNYSAALFTVPSGVYYWYWGKDPKRRDLLLNSGLLYVPISCASSPAEKSILTKETAAAEGRRVVSFPWTM